MARYTTLIRLLDKLRAELRLSKNPSHNTSVRESHIDILNRTQESLWQDYDWPHLRVERTIVVQAGQRIYDFPADLDMDRVEKLEVYDGSAWIPVRYGIGAAEYSTYNSDLDERANPVRAWKFAEGEDFEVWPISDVNGNATTQQDFLKFTGVKKYRPMVNDSDTADLDDNLIVLYCAAELMADSSPQVSATKLQRANNIFLRQRGGMAPRKIMGMLNVGRAPVPRRMAITRYRPPV
jgi:hypothetical protein